MINEVTLRNCIDFAINTEERGTNFYQQLADRFSDNEEIARLFTRLSRDELNHKQQFTSVLSNLPPENADARPVEKLDYLRAMSTPDFFYDKDGPFENLERIADRDDALEMAFNFEKATLAFYQAVEDIFGQNEPLNQIIEAEKLHISNLMTAMMVEGSRFRSVDDRWY
ncbi:MAG: ferritin family protein [Dehalococcoidia bacterium]